MEEFLEALAQYLELIGIGVYKLDSPYEADDRAIVFGEIPQDPAEIIALTYYGSQYVGTYNRSVESEEAGVQIRYRLIDLFGWSEVHRRLHDGLHRRKITLAGKNYIIRDSSFTPIGRDQNGRFEYSHNFTFSSLRVRSAEPLS